MKVRSFYKQLKGFKKNRAGELIIPGATNLDYEDLVDFLLGELSPVIQGDFPSFIWKVHCSYIRFYSCFTQPEFIRPRLDEELNTKQKLTLLKYYLYRRTYSQYDAKGES